LDTELSSSRTQLLLAQKKEESYENQFAELTVTIDNLRKELSKAKEKADSASSSTNGNLNLDFIFVCFFLLNDKAITYTYTLNSA
jgi:hypothetical protein